MSKPLTLSSPLGTDTSGSSTRHARLERLTSLMDDTFRLPGTSIRFGWDAILGLVPGIGDIVSTCLTAGVLVEAWRLGVSRWTLVRMVGNLVLDAAIGSVPVVGDVFDIAFKANRRNFRLLKADLERMGS